MNSTPFQSNLVLRLTSHNLCYSLKLCVNNTQFLMLSELNVGFTPFLILFNMHLCLTAQHLQYCSELCVNSTLVITSATVVF